MAMIGAYQSSVTKTASQATERLKIPYVCSDSSSPTLTERGFKYFFRVSPHDGIFARDQFKFLKDLEKAKRQKVKTSPSSTRTPSSAPTSAKDAETGARSSATRSSRTSPTRPTRPT